MLISISLAILRFIGYFIDYMFLIQRKLAVSGTSTRRSAAATRNRTSALPFIRQLSSSNRTRLKMTGSNNDVKKLISENYANGVQMGIKFASVIAARLGLTLLRFVMILAQVNRFYAMASVCDELCFSCLVGTTL